MRVLATDTLQKAGKHYALEFVKPSVPHAHVPGKWIGGRSYVMDNLYNIVYKDEFAEILAVIEHKLEQADLRDFQRAWGAKSSPRTDEVFEAELAKRLAMNPAGEHIPGLIGSTSIGTRKVGTEVVETPIMSGTKRANYQRFLMLNGTLMNRLTFSKWAGPYVIGSRLTTRAKKWEVYMGELDERAADSGVADPLPKGAQPFTESVFALNPKMSNEAAIFACDAIVDRLDEGSTAATIRGRTGTQPADVDATETGTLLFTLTMSATAFGAASDDTGKATATASAITADTSADATDTLTYCRVGATGSGADDHLDGSAGTSSADFIFNTVAIVTGTNVSMSTFTVSVSE